jgi:DHA3 family macrolide efflux protein-like MFS transporter
MYAHWGLNAAIALDVLGAIIACITVAVVSFPSQGSQTISDERHFITDFKEGYHVMQKHKGLFALLWIGTLYAFAYMPINALFPLDGNTDFGGTTTHASIIETAFAVGMMLGGILLGVWGGFRNRAVSIISSIFMMGASITISGLFPAKHL